MSAFKLEEAIAIIKVFEMPYVLLNSKRSFSWDGKNLAIYPKSDAGTSVIHELGH